MANRTLLETLNPGELAARWQERQAGLAERRLLDKVDTTLVLHDAELINTATGESRPLSAAEGPLETQLALAARALLGGRSTAGILLLLPPVHFAATRFDLAIKGEKLLRSALMLQVSQLLPACEQALMLGCNGRQSRGIALWLPEAKANALHAAFTTNDLPLVCLLPRPLAADHTSTCLDLDAHSRTLVDCRNGVVETWLAVQEQDLAHADFRQQWEEHLAGTGAKSQAAVLDHAWWLNLRRVVQAPAPYCFFPTGAIDAGKALVERRQRVVAGSAAAALVLLLALPFFFNQLQQYRLEQQLDDLVLASAPARQSQAAVSALEDAWGPVTRHPQQDIVGTLLTLNRYIEGGLSSFSIDRGVIDISGVAPDPALLVEQLAALETFHGVGQSRSSSGGNEGNRGARFGIRLQLTDVDFPAYEAGVSAGSEREDVGTLQQRIDHYQQLIAETDVWQQRELAMQAQVETYADWVLEGSNPGLAGSSVQRLLRQAVAGSGVAVREMSVARFSDKGDWLMVSQDMSFTLQQHQILPFLQTLDTLRPRLYITAFGISHNRGQYQGNLTVVGFSRKAPEGGAG